MLLQGCEVDLIACGPDAEMLLVGGARVDAVARASTRWRPPLTRCLRPMQGECTLVLAQSLSAVGRHAEAKKAVDKARPVFEHNHPKGHANLGIVAAVAAQIAEGSVRSQTTMTTMMMTIIIIIMTMTTTTTAVSDARAARRANKRLPSSITKRRLAFSTMPTCELRRSVRLVSFFFR